MTKTLQLQTLTCPSCITKIEKAVGAQKGVNKVEVLFNASKVKVNIAEDAPSDLNVKSLIEELGYEVISES